jgi:hypothetical protein
MTLSKRIYYLLLPAAGLIMAALFVGLLQTGESRAAGGGDVPDIALSAFATVDFSPTDIANTGVAGDDRLFVTLQDGRISVVESDGTVVATPFLSITNQIAVGGQMGLLGLVFDPDYDSNGYFYINYTYWEPAQRHRQHDVQECIERRGAETGCCFDRPAADPLEGAREWLDGERQ